MNKNSNVLFLLFLRIRILKSILKNKNSNVHSILHDSKISPIIGPIFGVDRGCLSVMHSFAVKH